MKKKYIVPKAEVIKVETENPLTAPSTWKIDDGPVIPIIDDINDPDDPTGAKQFDFYDDIQ